MFDGIRLETAAKRRSVISNAQYDEYQHEFGRKVRIRSPTRKKLRGIGGIKKVMGDATIQIPLKTFGLIIEVYIAILDFNIRTLLSNKDMIDNGLNLSI